MPPVPGRLGHVAGHEVLAILAAGGVLGQLAVTRYVLAGLIQFLEIVTLPKIPGDRIDDNPEYERGKLKWVVWMLLSFIDDLSDNTQSCRS